jgi:hypothetical protein
VVDPCSKSGFADWWKTTAADRFTKIGASALDHRRFWDAMIKASAFRHAGLAAATGQPLGQMTVVFDAGQNSDANFTELAATGLHYVGSVPAGDCPDLLALPAAAAVQGWARGRPGGLT